MLAPFSPISPKSNRMTTSQENLHALHLVQNPYTHAVINIITPIQPHVPFLKARLTILETFVRNSFGPEWLQKLRDIARTQGPITVDLPSGHPYFLLPFVTYLLENDHIDTAESIFAILPYDRLPPEEIKYLSLICFKHGQKEYGRRFYQMHKGHLKYDYDLKSAYLKSLQSRIWQEGNEKDAENARIALNILEKELLLLQQEQEKGGSLLYPHIHFLLGNITMALQNRSSALVWYKKGMSEGDEKCIEEMAIEEQFRGRFTVAQELYRELTKKGFSEGYSGLENIADALADRSLKKSVLEQAFLAGDIPSSVTLFEMLLGEVEKFPAQEPLPIPLVEKIWKILHFVKKQGYLPLSIPEIRGTIGIKRLIDHRIDMLKSVTKSKHPSLALVYLHDLATVACHHDSQIAYIRTLGEFFSNKEKSLLRYAILMDFFAQIRPDPDPALLIVTPERYQKAVNTLLEKKQKSMLMPPGLLKEYQDVGAFNVAQSEEVSLALIDHALFIVNTFSNLIEDGVCSPMLYKYLAEFSLVNLNMPAKQCFLLEKYLEGGRFEHGDTPSSIAEQILMIRQELAEFQAKYPHISDDE